MATETAVPHLDEMVTATSRFIGTLEGLEDADLRAASLLPGWSRGHVVTHVARNADSLCNLLHWAETGIETPQYPSRELRDAAIEAGAGRSAAELLADAAASAGRLRQAISALDVRHAEALVGGPPRFPARDVPLRRLVEVEVHHADLGAGYGPKDWSPAFAVLLLRRTLADRRDGPPMRVRATDTTDRWSVGSAEGPEVSGSAADLAWWLSGRGDGAGVSAADGALPELGPWR